MALDRATLNSLCCEGCGNPDHDKGQLYLVPRCHPSARLNAFYDKKRGCLTILCGQCKKKVTEVQVAEHL